MGNTFNKKTNSYSSVDEQEIHPNYCADDSIHGDEMKDSFSSSNVTKKCLQEARKAFVEGNALFREGRYDLAKAEYAGALQILKDNEDPSVLHAATALSNMGILEFADGRYSEAKRLLEEALSLRRGWSLQNQSIRNNIDGMEAISFNLTRDSLFWKAPEEQKILAQELSDHGAIDGVIADTINNIGACLELLGRIDEAKPMYEESLELRKVVFGNRSVKVAESMLNLATILDSRGHLMEAEGLLNEALDIYKEKRGHESPEVAVTMNNLGVLLTHLGRLDEAKSLLESVVLIRNLCYGEENPQTISAVQNLEYIRNKQRSMATRSANTETDVQKSI